MDARRLSKGEWLAGLSAVVLLVSLFLPWYGAGGQTATAWETMAANDVIIALAALLALTAVLLAARSPLAGLTVGTTSLSALGATFAALLVLIRVASPAPEVDVGLEIGAWLGLLSVLALVVGCWAAMRDEGPARRDPRTERIAAEEGVARSELLPLPPDVGGVGSSSPSG